MTYLDRHIHKLRDTESPVQRRVVRVDNKDVYGAGIALVERPGDNVARVLDPASEARFISTKRPRTRSTFKSQQCARTRTTTARAR